MNSFWVGFEKQAISYDTASRAATKAYGKFKNNPTNTALRDRYLRLQKQQWKRMPADMKGRS